MRGADEQDMAPQTEGNEVIIADGWGQAYDWGGIVTIIISFICNQ
jgi:hypothetical protein